LFVTARKPAPVQAVWLGYFHSTGMLAIDYIIADPTVCPEGEDGQYVETVARLPHSFLCFNPPDDSPVVSRLPAREYGHITFGCFNNPLKISDGVIAAWARILQGVPRARLLLKSFPFDNPASREHVARRFARHDIDLDRITFLGRSALPEHLAAYNQVDIALDPFPYNGGVTTLDALWMGVPVVTLRGTQFVGRMGASILTTLNMPELIAATPDEYVERGIQSGQDLTWLEACRASLRERLLTSPLCDGPALARGLEALYRSFWQTWCATQQLEVQGRFPVSERSPSSRDL
jgi:protein O-GlcNAc transferase